MGDEILKIDEMTLEYTTLPEVYQLLKNNDRSHIRLEIKPSFSANKSMVDSNNNHNNHQNINEKTSIVSKSSINGGTMRRNGILHLDKYHDTDKLSSLGSAKYGRSSMRSKNGDSVDTKYCK